MTRELTGKWKRSKADGSLVWKWKRRKVKAAPPSQPGWAALVAATRTATLLQAAAAVEELLCINHCTHTYCNAIHDAVDELHRLAEET